MSKAGEKILAGAAEARAIAKGQAMKAEGWAVVGGPMRQTYLATVRGTKAEAIDAMSAIHSVRKPWSFWEAQGYRCVPVTIEERS